MKRTYKVFVAIRHTRAGDQRLGVFDNSEAAMAVAERAADEAAGRYGYGSASAFRAVLTVSGRALKAKEGR